MRGGLSRQIIVFLAVCIVLLQVVAGFSLDIQVDKLAYTIGENVTFKVILVDGDKEIVAPLKVLILDSYDGYKQEVDAVSNKEQNFKIGNNFAGGYWKIETSYEGKGVKRFFSVKEKEDVKFIIEEDRLIIKNSGNVPYEKTLQILIGDKVITQKQSIAVGEKKEIKLVAPEGLYNIEVNDGNNIVKKADVKLTGTGRVIGALDEDLLGYSYLTGGVREGEDGFLISRYSTVLFVFIGVVTILFILLLIERKLVKSIYRKK